jgi:hypothetical protein
MGTMKYKVEIGKTKYEGFVSVTVMVGSPPIITVFDNLYRMLSPYEGDSYKTRDPKYQLTECDMIVKSTMPFKMTPLFELDENRIPYALVRQGTWWEHVVVPYVVIDNSNRTKSGIVRSATEPLKPPPARLMR